MTISDSWMNISLHPVSSSPHRVPPGSPQAAWGQRWVHPSSPHSPTPTPGTRLQSGTEGLPFPRETPVRGSDPSAPIFPPAPRSATLTPFNAPPTPHSSPAPGARSPPRMRAALTRPRLAMAPPGSAAAGRRRKGRGAGAGPGAGGCGEVPAPCIARGNVPS